MMVDVYEITKFFNMIENLGIKSSKSEKFTLPCVFGKEFAENFMSDWLAYIINPYKNGVGIEPLQMLIDLAGYDYTFNDDSIIKITREYVFVDSGRRIDFYIDVDDKYIIAIENKINASEGENQFRDYWKSLEDLKKNNKLICAIILKPNSNKTVEDKNFKIVHYEELIEQYRKIQLNFIENLRSAFLIKEFIIHMEEYIMTTTDLFTLNDEDLSEIIKHKALLNKINQRNNEVNSNLKKHIINEVKKEFPDDTIWNFNYSDNFRFFQLFKVNWKNSNIHFELFLKDPDLLIKTSNSRNCSIELHVECKGEKGKKIINELKKIDISNSYYVQASPQKAIHVCIFDLKYDFDSDENMKKNIVDIIALFKLLDHNYSNIIDNMINDLNITNCEKM